MARGVRFTTAYRLLTGNHVFVCFKCFHSNAPYFHDILRLFEGAILFPVVNNALGIGRPDALKGAKLINRGFVNIDFHLFLGHYSANSRCQQKSKQHKASQNLFCSLSHFTLLPLVLWCPSPPNSASSSQCAADS